MRYCYFKHPSVWLCAITVVTHPFYMHAVHSVTELRLSYFEHLHTLRLGIVHKYYRLSSTGRGSTGCQIAHTWEEGHTGQSQGPSHAGCSDSPTYSAQLKGAHSIQDEGVPTQPSCVHLQASARRLATM